VVPIYGPQSIELLRPCLLTKRSRMIVLPDHRDRLVFSALPPLKLPPAALLGMETTPELGELSLSRTVFLYSLTPHRGKPQHPTLFSPLYLVWCSPFSYRSRAFELSSFLPRCCLSSGFGQKCSFFFFFFCLKLSP